MIDDKKLIKYRNKAETYLRDLLKDLKFNHYGIKARDSKAYKKIIRHTDTISEVVFHNRRIATVRKNRYILEILEPRSDETVIKTDIDHVAYVCHNFDRFPNNYFGEIISRFDVGSTHGIKISPAKGTIIEIRNNDILDSVKDFKS